MTGLILHHYDASPFTQKALRMFGLKQLAWRSVETPMIMPKPDLTRLTGGYRGTPVLQAGADVYIDTQLIARELERRHPRPTLFPADNRGLDYALVKWGDDFFQAGLEMAINLVGPSWDTAFAADREALFDHLSFARISEDASHAITQLRAHCALLEDQLADGRAFLSGDEPGLVDIQAFSVPWFARAAMPVTEKLLARFVSLPPWEARVAALGEGVRTDITAAVALAEARLGQPDLSTNIDADDPLGLQPLAKVAVEAADFSRRGVVEGELLRLTPLTIAVLRRDSELGDIVVHFPRLGYRVSPL